jgi:hypothetical protein
MPKPFSEIITRASQLGGPGSSQPVSDGDLFKIPNYEEDFVSDRFPHFNGHISLRYPSFGDEVDIEAYAMVMGGTAYARIHSALSTCLESAPPSWWAANQAKRTVDPAIGRITDSPALIGLYNRWIKWRDTFRVGSAGSGPAGTEPAPEAPMERISGLEGVTVQL